MNDLLHLATLLALLFFLGSLSFLPGKPNNVHHGFNFEMRIHR